MGKFSEAYLKIIYSFIKHKIDVNTFYKKFSKLFYDKSLKPESMKLFKLIEELWGWLDKYESNLSQRAKMPDLLDEEQLLNIVKKYKVKIEKEL